MKYYRIWTGAAGTLLTMSLIACGTTATTNTTPTAVSAPAAATVAAPAATTGAAVPTSAAPTTGTAAQVPIQMVKLNLNTATSEQLMATIPNFSNRMVREFMEYRPYISIQQFRKEIGKYVDTAQVTAYEQYVYVPVAINDSDAATLQQLPGVDATSAAALLAARPYASTDAFLAQLGQQVSAAQVAAAKAYLAP